MAASAQPHKLSYSIITCMVLFRNLHCFELLLWRRNIFLYVSCSVYFLISSKQNNAIGYVINGLTTPPSLYSSRLKGQQSELIFFAFSIMYRRVIYDLNLVIFSQKFAKIDSVICLLNARQNILGIFSHAFLYILDAYSLSTLNYFWRIWR
jgi:hypothetical protein